MRFEQQKDLDRETKAISFFCKNYDLIYQKLGDNDIDFKITKDNKVVSYIEVKGRIRNIDECYPLPIAVRKLYKLKEKHHNPIIIWACNDGILYAKVNELVGEVKIGGRKPRQGSSNDIELMVYYNKQENIKILKYD